MSKLESQKTIFIGEKTIGQGAPCYLIAEVGTTCLGNLDMALQLVEAGAKAGMDAVKFQLIDANQLSDSSVTYPIQRNGVTEYVNMKEMFERLHFSQEQWKKIAEHCTKHNVHFFATTDFIEGIDQLEHLNVPAHKLGAWDCTYRPLIEKMGQTGKPMFVDLGPTTQDEIDDITQWYLSAGGSSIIYLHDFHTSIDAEMNMAAITYLDQTQVWPVGYSSPGHDHDLDFLALGLGATVLEKRLIIDRSLAAFHAHESLEPDELKNWVERIRHIERAIGKPAIIPSQKDLEDKKKYYRSICTTSPVKQGQVFSLQNLDGKRPGNGVPTARLSEFIGRKATRDLQTDSLLQESDRL